MPSRLSALLAAALVVLAASAPSFAASGAYVSLGDSYTAGPLIPNQSLSPLGCLRSDRNYPHVVRPGLTDIATFRDPSCSGATTDDMANSQGVTPGPNPPQFNSLTTDTRVVTLGIGGNDIGFSSIVQNCARLNPFDPCKDDYVIGSTDLIANRIAAARPKVDAVLDGIAARAPSAKVFVVGYPTVLPATGNGCWPTVPVLPTDTSYLRTKVAQLNAMLAASAASRGDIYVDTASSSVGHDFCKSASVKWVEGIVPVNTAAPVHPNQNGMANTGAVVLAAIVRAGY
ncbi:SGNH/GDSL hydrolase family protein [Conexibacter sp. JD483]|uniref:SGNH/GDSL hydrolase family protein n=1 Tax=unclassified Conexibacter TaxID=2627773 RepID=UPI00271A59F6|nr:MULTISPECIES: SGNH/GDSL hydrolase family protein [unclassified Conexibacter]MDO8184881.1 SGNH/GDSL hydrolase family protein [Conexibacter sp. CPCC 205706]MDO8196656.1 SGNH/GDSL hydrolase family protein [Conexibacter sp. CPCC 205762]MDR9371963.1 SGNH/GDSL hydrolase family protein [Conexibacter sp. JD483]